MDDQEIEPKQTEPAPKEPTPKEQAAATKEKESQASQWTHPLVISLIGASLALGGNIITNILTNRASDKAEHFRAQSNLVLSVIKTNGNEEDACKNLNFFVRIGWLDDPNGAIHNSCGTKGEGGVPTLPATSESGAGGAGYGSGGYGIGGYGVGGLLLGAINTLTVRVENADSHEPIANAKVDLEQTKVELVQPNGLVSNSLGVSSSVVQSTATGATGDAVLSFVSSLDSLVVSKDGYDSVRKPMSQFGLGGSQTSATVIIDLHPVPAPKH
jgi:hypothetical protein